MSYKWIGPGNLGFGKDATKVGDVLPEKFSDRVDEFLKDKKIKLIQPKPVDKKPAPKSEPEQVKESKPEKKQTGAGPKKTDKKVNKK